MVSEDMKDYYFYINFPLQLYMSRHVFKLDELGSEIAQIALPAALALTADPIASLVDTAFIGQIGILIICCIYPVHQFEFSC